MKEHLNNMKTCKGCGAILQTTKEKELGFVNDLSFDYCLNCFSIKHYNRPLEEVSQVHFPIIKGKGLIVYLISSLHINLLYKYDLKKFYPNHKILLLINKIDLLPKTVNFDFWINDIKKEAKRHHIDFLEVMPISALKGKYLDIFLETLIHFGFKDIYFVGLQNSGKSTLINKIAERLEQSEVALTSNFPGLTKDNIELNFYSQTIIDTPGVFEKGLISDYLEYQDFNKLIPNKAIKPINFNLNSNQSIIVGGFLIISYIKGNRKNFSFYLGNVNLHRTKYENVYDLFNKHKGDLFQPVIKEDYEKLYFKLNGNNKYMISIFDLGYLVVKGEGTIEVYVPKGANITIKKDSYHGL